MSPLLSLLLSTATMIHLIALRQFYNKNHSKSCGLAKNSTPIPILATLYPRHTQSLISHIVKDISFAPSKIALSADHHPLRLQPGVLDLFKGLPKKRHMHALKRCLSLGVCFSGKVMGI
ncbi:hypothetical protein M441DRAFT_255615 [Trichoderma asperellum CBS 433.97]|uniref:Uncharacterized protein n=1 Tax=Trichoderma asperellum (strain ATCC 204424 / CBS 433.97 / NBRC 101777) TaxID=1042311 RepID=A0A2T3YYU6_TRIA4|nr:hypothetical protein M441DRAFT_255615 [Trichoderma asperellum CBS 433.97]PTB37690.1 hypothetical protein M441DRAFT_255615 [Trichoderma asperellum CBS 433.97]